GMIEHGFAPDWVAGVSIGAINASLIAGNPPEQRVQRIAEFWDLVSANVQFTVPATLDPIRLAFNRLSATATAAFGVPGFFVPRVPPPFFVPEGSLNGLS